MRVLLVAPDVAVNGSAPGSAADALEELGSRFSAVGLDLAGVDEQAERSPTLVVVDTPDRLVTGAGILRRLRAHPQLARVPVVLVMSPRQIVELDPELSPSDVMWASAIITRRRPLIQRPSAIASPSRIGRVKCRLKAVVRRKRSLIRLFAA